MEWFAQFLKFSSDNHIVTIAFWVGGIVTAGRFIYKYSRAGWRSSRGVRNFLDDWNGEPARKGVVARPGMMARQAAAEEAVRAAVEVAKANAVQLAAIEHELHPNSGSSMFDKLSKRLDGLSEENAALDGKLETHLNEVAAWQAAHPSKGD